MRKKTIIQAVGIVLILIFRASQHTYLKGIQSDFLDTVLSYIFFVLALGFIKGIAFYLYRKNKNLGLNDRDNIISGVNNIYVLVIGIVGILTGISLFGVDVKGMFASLSIIAAAIAIISKDYISNVIGGMLIAFSNDVNVGDYVKVGENKGKVIDMSITMFSLLTEDDDVAIIPNNMVYALDLVNYTKRVIKKTSIEFEVALEPMQTVKQLEEDLINTLEEYYDIIEPNSYNLKTVAIKKDYLEFKFQYILNSPDRDMEKVIRKKVIRRVVQIIKKL